MTAKLTREQIIDFLDMKVGDKRPVVASADAPLNAVNNSYRKLAEIAGYKVTIRSFPFDGGCWMWRMQDA